MTMEGTERPKRRHRKLTIVTSAGIIFVLALLSQVLIQSAITRPEANKVVASKSWIGTDNTHYYNITVAYEGGQQTYLVTCNMFPVNSTSFPLRYYPRFLLIPSWVGIDGSGALPPGCS